MPTFPTYLRDQSIQPPGVPQVEIGSGAVVAGMNKLAAGVGRLGDAAEAVQNKVEQAQDFDVNQRHTLLREQTQTAWQEYLKTAPANGAGVKEGFLKVAKPMQDAFLKDVPARLVPQYQRRLQIDTENVMQTAAQGEDALRSKWDNSQILDSIDKYQTAVMRDPKAADTALADLDHSIDLAPSFTPQEKELKKKAMREQIRTAQAMGAFPTKEAMAKELGVPTAESKAAGKYVVPNAKVGAAQADREKVAMSYFQGRGLSQNQAAGLVGNLIHESAGLQSGIKNPGDGSDGSDSIGMGQWNGPRARALKAFAASQGKDWNDFNVQLAFVWHELNTNYSGVKQRLLAAQSPDDAAGVIVTGYERPRGSQSGAAASHGWANRRDQARRLAGGTYNPADVQTTEVDAPTGAGNPAFDDIPFEKKLSLVNWAATQENQAQALARGNLEPRLQDEQAALLATGSYGGAPITRQDMDAAYGPAEGGVKFAQLERVRAVGQKVDAMKLSPDADNMAAVNAAKPVDTGPGYAQRQAEYEAIGQAQAAIAKARKEDPAGWAMSVAPQLSAAFQDHSPEGFQKALLAMGAFQTKVGIKPEDQQLMPKLQAKAVVDAFKNPEADANKRAGAVVGTIFATKDPTQQRAIFQQLVREGLPAESEGAIEAFAAGRTGDGDTLMQAVLSDPAKLPMKMEATPAQIKDAIQTSFGQVMDAAYGITIGRPENIDRATRGGDLMVKAVQMRMAKNESMADAVKATVDNMFGKGFQTLDITQSGLKAAVFVPAGQDPDAISKKLDASIGAITEGMKAAATALNEKTYAGKPQALAIAQADAESHIHNVFGEGRWINLNGGYAFFDPYTGRVVPGKDGAPLIIRMDAAPVQETPPAAMPAQPSAPAPAVEPAAPVAAPPTRAITPPPPTEKSPAQTLEQQMRDVRKAGMGDIPALGVLGGGQ